MKIKKSTTFPVTLFKYFESWKSFEVFSKGYEGDVAPCSIGKIIKYIKRWRTMGQNWLFRKKTSYLPQPRLARSIKVMNALLYYEESTVKKNSGRSR